MIPIRERAQFAGAVRTKIIREIADLREPAPAVVTRAQAGATDCMAGERQADQWWRN
jgi:hypothetical protein